jgi:hypothetical protein
MRHNHTVSAEGRKGDLAMATRREGFSSVRCSVCGTNGHSATRHNGLDVLVNLERTPEAIRISSQRSSNPSPLWLVNEIAASISAHVYTIRRAQEAK